LSLQNNCCAATSNRYITPPISHLFTPSHTHLFTPSHTFSHLLTPTFSHLLTPFHTFSHPPFHHFGCLVKQNIAENFEKASSVPPDFNLENKTMLHYITMIGSYYVSMRPKA